MHSEGEELGGGRNDRKYSYFQEAWTNIVVHRECMSDIESERERTTDIFWLRCVFNPKNST